MCTDWPVCRGWRARRRRRSRACQQQQETTRCYCPPVKICVHLWACHTHTHTTSSPVDISQNYFMINIPSQTPHSVWPLCVCVCVCVFRSLAFLQILCTAPPFSPRQPFASPLFTQPLYVHSHLLLHRGARTPLVRADSCNALFQTLPSRLQATAAALKDSQLMFQPRIPCSSAATYAYQRAGTTEYLKGRE